MATRPGIEADLAFEVDVAGERTVAGTLRGSGARLRLDVDRPEVFAGPADAGAVRTLARGLAERGLVVDVVHQGTRLLSLGATRAPWWQRGLTRSRHIRLAGLRGVLAPQVARLRRGESLLPDSGLVPPPTLVPLVPTFARPRRRPATTTHAAPGAGSPRLTLSWGNHRWPSERRTVYWLDGETTRIGSGSDADIRLDELDELHAEVRHDEDDEYVVLGHSPETWVHGERRESALLRTGTRLQVGPWTLVYTREEYADHGRPYGGRIGGELGHQRSQPPRERMQDAADD